MGEVLLSLALVALVLVVYFIYFKDEEKLVIVYKNQNKEEYVARISQNIRNQYNDSFVTPSGRFNKKLSPIKYAPKLNLNQNNNYPKSSFLSCFIPKRDDESKPFKQTQNYQSKYRVDLTSDRKQAQGALLKDNLFRNSSYGSPIRRAEEKIWEPNFFEESNKMQRQSSMKKERFVFKDMKSANLEDYLSNNKSIVNKG
jgi:hypothetical protein